MFVFFAIVAYLLIVFVGLRIVVPHLGFSQAYTAEPIPFELHEVIARLNSESENDKDFLKQAYNYVVRRYTGSRTKTVTHFWRAFGPVLTKESGYLPCAGQNYVLKTMLLSSGRFDEKDIRTKTIPLNLFLHQYLEVTVESETYTVDPWAHFLGVPFGSKVSFVG